MSTGFSSTNRQTHITRLQTEHFDLLIIGGGITGAGIALDAAARGLRVAVVEKHDFASGTSSRSTKLIHGGLRYLKQLEFGLVKEVGSERAVVHNLAPHLVIPGKMLLPLAEGKSVTYWLTSIGLMIYDRLAGVKKEDQRKMLTRPQTIRNEPLLRRNNIKGGALYAEYRTDDARLTLEIMKTAVRHGVVALNYLQVNNFVNSNEQVSGVTVTDEISRESFVIKATAVVSAAGPWVDELRALNKSKTGKRLQLTKGVHVVVPYDRFPVQQAIYFEATDGRMIFAIPRGKTTYLGTTDTEYHGDKDRVITTAEDASYLIDAANGMFPSIKLTLQDIVSHWAGLRPLIYEEGKSMSELSRKDEIFESPSGLISIAGGKLTGYRKMAERVVDLVIHRYFQGKPLKPCHTAFIKLAGNNFTSANDVRNYIMAMRKRLQPHNFSVTEARGLVETYGKQADMIAKYFEENHTDGVAPGLSMLKAQLWFGVHHEMVFTLEDFFVRRTGLLYFDIEAVRTWKTDIAEALQAYLGWTDTRKESELAIINKHLEEAVFMEADSHITQPTS